MILLTVLPTTPRLINNGVQCLCRWFIHPSAWKVKFSELRLDGVLRSSQETVNHMIPRCVQIRVCMVWRGSPTKGGRQSDEETDPAGSARPSACADRGRPRGGQRSSHQPRSILDGRKR